MLRPLLELDLACFEVRTMHFRPGGLPVCGRRGVNVVLHAHMPLLWASADFIGLREWPSRWRRALGATVLAFGATVLATITARREHLIACSARSHRREDYRHVPRFQGAIGGSAPGAQLTARARVVGRRRTVKSRH